MTKYLQCARNVGFTCRSINGGATYVQVTGQP